MFHNTKPGCASIMFLNWGWKDVSNPHISYIIAFRSHEMKIFLHLSHLNIAPSTSSLRFSLPVFSALVSSTLDHCYAEENPEALVIKESSFLFRVEKIMGSTLCPFFKDSTLFQSASWCNSKCWFLSRNVHIPWIARKQPLFICTSTRAKALLLLISLLLFCHFHAWMVQWSLYLSLSYIVPINIDLQYLRSWDSHIMGYGPSLPLQISMNVLDHFTICIFTLYFCLDRKEIALSIWVGRVCLWSYLFWSAWVFLKKWEGEKGKMCHKWYVNEVAWKKEKK